MCVAVLFFPTAEVSLVFIGASYDTNLIEKVQMQITEQ